MTTMHQDFPKLFVEISADGAARDLRWQGVAAFTKEYTRQKAEVLVRLAFGTKPAPGGTQRESLGPVFAAFHKAFADADSSFTPGGRQDQVLAAAALLQFMIRSSFSAMAITQTALDGARSAKLPVDLVAAAESALSRLGASRRVRPDLDKATVVAPKFECEVDLSQAQPSAPQTFKPAFDQIAVAVNAMLADLIGSVNGSFEKFVDANRMADEELDMLHWVFGGRSIRPDSTFTDVPALEKPLVFARDLASLTKIYPGPNGVASLMLRAGVKATGKVKLVDAVNAVSKDWIVAALKDRAPSPASSPIHYALNRREETGGDTGWENGWAAVTGLDPAASLPPIRLATLFYREILWLR